MPQFTKCQNCGIPRRMIFVCEKCHKKMCLGCFNFVKGLCSECSTDQWELEYDGLLANPLEISTSK